ncbi:MAG: 3-oxoadipate enol-lactonase [Pseudomonadota bacterium]
MATTASIGDVILHYARSGTPGGHPFVFSNSLGTDFRVWDPLLPHLPVGLDILRYDKRGHGLSGAPDGPWRMDDYVADLAGLMEAQGLSGAVICGLSVGGLIAQGLAASRPDLVRALILCDTGAKIGTETMWNDRIAAVRAQGLESIADAVMERWFAPGFRADRVRLAPWRTMLARTPAEGYARTGEAIRDADYRASTAELRLPCLAVCGAHDGSTPPELVRQTAALIPGSRFALIEEAGHIPCVEQPAVLAAHISRFLEEIGAG